MAEKYMKRNSTLLIMRETQIKTTMRHYLTPVKRGVLSKIISIYRDLKNCNPCVLLMGM